MPVISHNRLEQYEIPGIAHRTVVSRRLGTESFEVWDQTLACGAATPPHSHHCEEAVVVLSGSGQLMVDGNIESFAAPCTLTVPANAAHQISNSGKNELRLLCRAVERRHRRTSGDGPAAVAG
jgi:mannose-6-phosphate isomerase-like protein (cupin superfamily)